MTMATRITGWKIFVIVLAIIPPAWVAGRASSSLSREWIVGGMANYLPDDRMQSFDYRLAAEDSLVSHALERPLFGWTRDGFNRTTNADGVRATVVVDGLWLSAFGVAGILGLIASLSLPLMPLLLALAKAPPKSWKTAPESFLYGAVGIAFGIIAIDNLFNNMINPMFLLLMGAINSVLTSKDWKTVVAGDRPEENGQESEGPAGSGPATLQPQFRRVFGRSYPSD